MANRMPIVIIDCFDQTEELHTLCTVLSHSRLYKKCVLSGCTHIYDQMIVRMQVFRAAKLCQAQRYTLLCSHSAVIYSFR